MRGCPTRPGDREVDRLRLFVAQRDASIALAHPAACKGQPHLFNGRQYDVSEACRLGGWVAVPWCLLCVLGLRRHSAPTFYEKIQWRTLMEETVTHKVRSFCMLATVVAVG